MLHFRARITYSENAIERLCRAQHRLFNAWRILIVYAACIAVMAASVIAEMPQARKILLIAVCGIGISLTNYIPRYKAKTMAAAMRGSFPTVTYSFFSSGFELENGEDKRSLEYSVIKRLAGDDEYIYLFTGNTSAYIIDRTRIRPRDPDGLLRFLEEKTGKTAKHLGGFRKLTLSGLLMKKGK